MGDSALLTAEDATLTIDSNLLEPGRVGERTSVIASGATIHFVKPGSATKNIVPIVAEEQIATEIAKQMIIERSPAKYVVAVTSSEPVSAVAPRQIVVSISTLKSIVSVATFDLSLIHI